MAGRGPQTFQKRQKEQQRKERQQEKIDKRAQRKQQKENGTGEGGPEMGEPFVYEPLASDAKYLP
jgi:hypothetical protein